MNKKKHDLYECTRRIKKEDTKKTKQVFSKEKLVIDLTKSKTKKRTQSNVKKKTKQSKKDIKVSHDRQNQLT